MSVLKKALLGTAMAATALVTATPADAQYYRRHRYHNDDGALAIGAGIIGLGIGAAIASNSRGGYYDPYYGGGYGGYSSPYYGGYSSYGYNGYGYGGYSGYGYADPYYRYNDYGYRCRTTRQWDPYWRRWVRVRYC